MRASIRKDLLAEIDRAIEAFHDKKGWTRLMRNGMARDYSWSGPAKEYVKVYEAAAQRRRVSAGRAFHLLTCELLRKILDLEVCNAISV